VQKKEQEFAYGSAGQGSGLVSAVAWVTAVVGIRSLAWELPHAHGCSKEKKKKRKEKKENTKISTSPYKSRIEKHGSYF